MRERVRERERTPASRDLDNNDETKQAENEQLRRER